MLVREIMTSRPTVVAEDETLLDAARKMRDVDVGMLPVVWGGSGNRLAGVITDRDLVIRHLAQPHDGPCFVSSHMTSEGLETVGPEDDLETALRIMKRARVRRLPVVDGNRCVVGILAQADIARDLGPRDPEEVERLLEAVSAPSLLPNA